MMNRSVITYRRIINLILCIAVVLSAVACSSTYKERAKGIYIKSEAEAFVPAADLDRNFSYVINVCGNWGNFEALDYAGIGFKKYYPNIDVVYNKLDDIGNDLSKRVYTGNDVEMYMTEAFASTDPKESYLWDNAEDISGSEIDLSNVDEEMLKFGYIDGKQLLVPIYNNPYGLVVNETLLKEYGLEIPRDYREFLHCCEVFKASNVQAVFVPNMQILTNTYMDHLYEKLMKNSDGEDVSLKLMQGSDDLGILEETLNEINTLFDKGYVHAESGRLSDEYGAVIIRFFEGNVPFVLFPSTFYSGTRKREAMSEAYKENPFSYSFVPFPGNDGYKCFYRQMGAVYMGVNTNLAPQIKSYVLEFLRYLLSDEGSLILERVKNMPTANTNVGNADFKYLYELKEEECRYIGATEESDVYLKLDLFLRNAGSFYEPGISADEFLENGLRIK